MVQTVENGLPVSGLSSERPSNGEPGQRYKDTQTGEYSVYNGNSWDTVSAGSGQRIQLDWVAGLEGKPGINADFVSTTEAESTIANRHFEILGANAVRTSSAINAEGGVTFTTEGADGDGCFLVPHLDAGLTPWTEITWGTDESVNYKCTFVTGAAITNSIIWAGLKLTNTDVVITDADQVFVRYENAIDGGAWTVNSSVGGTDTETVTTDIVAVSTVYSIEINIDSDRIAKTYINGVLQQTSSALTTAIDFIPYIAVEADGAAEAKTLTIRGCSISRDYA